MMRRPSPFSLLPSRQCGFTLVEMIVVIVITGILGSMVAMFIKAPVQGYMDSARRAEMTGIADIALHRMGRDIRTAVPNSVRLPTPAGSTYIEFLPTKAGGRYRANPAPSGAVKCGGTLAQDILDFTIADPCFEILGPPITFDPRDYIVVGSTQPDGNPPYDDTAAGILRMYIGATGAPANSVVTFGVQFPAFAELPSHRFEVVPGNQRAVTYSCEGVGVAGGEGTGTLRRYWAYGFNAVQVLPSGPPNAVLADRISSCSFAYAPVNQRNGLVAITLGITRGNESISLYQEVHVNNAP
ncbi:MAG: type II secretion system protein [Nitrosomonadales bacterium]|nr:type II secretion system protein [Nitrosomonadales bacterium]